MKGAIHVYAVVRVDLDRLALGKSVDDPIVVKEVLPTLEEAQSEVERLMALNKDKRVVYFWRTTRFLPNGRKAAREGDGTSSE